KILRGRLLGAGSRGGLVVRVRTLIESAVPEKRMPATKKGKTKKTAAPPRPQPSALPVLRPRDGRMDVKIAGDWLERWLPELDEIELKSYLEIAHFYNIRTYHDANELQTIFGKGKKAKIDE